MSACIGEPVSWFQLELYGLGELPAAQAAQVAEHLAQCPMCEACYARIAQDTRVFVPQLSAAAPKRRSRVLAWSSAALTAAVALGALLMVRPEPVPQPDRMDTKGGDLALELVRIDATGRQLEPRKFAPGDRFKLLFSCPADAAGAVRVLVFQGDERFEPLPQQRVEVCGNRRNLAGALQLDGARPVDVCVVSIRPGERAGQPAPIEAARTPSQLPQPNVCAHIDPE